VITGSASLTGGIAVMRGGTGLLASYLPARRLSRVEPTIALRAE
jgi:ABC-type lipoprotein release transport system permease subunit